MFGGEDRPQRAAKQRPGHRRSRADHKGDGDRPVCRCEVEILPDRANSDTLLALIARAFHETGGEQQLGFVTLIPLRTETNIPIGDRNEATARIDRRQLCGPAPPNSNPLDVKDVPDPNDQEVQDAQKNWVHFVLIRCLRRVHPSATKEIVVQR
jgi:hypothetical protein